MRQCPTPIKILSPAGFKPHDKHTNENKPAKLPHPPRAPRASSSLIRNNAEACWIARTMVESAIAGTKDRDNNWRQGQGSGWANATLLLALYLLRPLPSYSSRFGNAEPSIRRISCQRKGELEAGSYWLREKLMDQRCTQANRLPQTIRVKDQTLALIVLAQFALTVFASWNYRSLG